VCEPCVPQDAADDQMGFAATIRDVPACIVSGYDYFGIESCTEVCDSADAGLTENQLTETGVSGPVEHLLHQKPGQSIAAVFR